MKRREKGKHKKHAQLDLHSTFQLPFCLDFQNIGSVKHALEKLLKNKKPLR